MYAYNLRDYVKVVEIESSEIDYINFDLCEQPRETLGAYYNRQLRKPNLLINGGFFNLSSGQTCFSFVDDGNIITNHYGVKQGLGTTIDDQAKLIFGGIDDNIHWYDFIAGYPVLVENGEAKTAFTWASEINYKATRSAMGITGQNKLIFVTVSKPGVDLKELAAIMKNVGCLYAINLDGGGSSRMLVNGEVVNDPTENRSVDSVVAVYLKDTSSNMGEVEYIPYISYTVQKGDSMWKIATEYLGSGSRYKEIVEFNNLSSSVLKVGQVLKIAIDCEKYTVQYGDTLWSIAAKKLGSGVKYKYLMEFNNLATSVLNVGQVIYIPV